MYKAPFDRRIKLEIDPELKGVEVNIFIVKDNLSLSLLKSVFLK